jgi:nicotinamide-nucleotide amidase
MNVPTTIERKDLDIISKILIARIESVSIAESVTAGLIQARLSLAKEAMMFFHGGITAYNLGQKTKHLAIDPIIAERSNCVSSEIAAQMALNVSKLFNSTWGIAVTGYAAPVPQLKVRECFCHFAIAYQGELVLQEKMNSNLKSILHVQQYYVSIIVRQFAQLLKSFEPRSPTATRTVAR